MHAEISKVRESGVAGPASPLFASPLFASLRRITAGSRYIPEIDGLRFLAIGSVLVYHVAMLAAMRTAAPSTAGCSGGLYRMVMHLDRGVPMFFAISGLVLGLPFARHHLCGEEPVRWKPYLLRRATRLEPPYVVNLLMRLPLVMATKHLSGGAALLHLGASLLYADWAVFGEMPLLHPPSWSLAVEVQFYLLAPLLAALLFRRGKWLRWTLCPAAILGGSAVAAHLPGNELHGALHLSLLYFSQYFLVGLLVADLYSTVLPRLREHALWDVAALPLLLLFFTVGSPAALYLMPPVLAVVLVAALRGRLLPRLLRLSFVSTAGGMCYSLYLTHSLVLQAVFFALDRCLPERPAFPELFALGTLVALPAVMAVGTLFFVLVERPCMDKHWPRRLAALLRGHSAAAKVAP